MSFREGYGKILPVTQPQHSWAAYWTAKREAPALRREAMLRAMRQQFNGRPTPHKETN